ncbi:hypothetical protein N872_08525 [Neisseria meningitidis LNP27256]|nr:hypothetical protein N872_08525 [Neisseria meningitidis LNP27256]
MPEPSPKTVSGNTYAPRSILTPRPICGEIRRARKPRTRLPTMPMPRICDGGNTEPAKRSSRKKNFDPIKPPSKELFIVD